MIRAPSHSSRFARFGLVEGATFLDCSGVKQLRLCVLVSRSSLANVSRLVPPRVAIKYSAEQSSVGGHQWRENFRSWNWNEYAGEVAGQLPDISALVSRTVLCSVEKLSFVIII